MKKEFEDRLKEYLDSECSDYGLEYSYEWNEDCNCCDVLISRDDSQKQLSFKYDEQKDDLLIELCEDYYYVTREFDWSVKYFWMLISPSLFPNN